MSFKVAFIGAGSIGFTRSLLRDLLTVPEFRNIEVSFTDINDQNLDMVTQLCQRDIEENRLDISIHATTDRRAALKDAKYIFNVVRIGGLEAFKTDIDITLTYEWEKRVASTVSTVGKKYGP